MPAAAKKAPAKRKSRQGKGGGPKPRVFTAKEIAQVEAYAATLNLDQIAQAFGISRTCFNDIRKRQPKVELAYQVGTAKAVNDVATGLLAQAKKGNVTAMIFYLKTKGGYIENAPPEIKQQPVPINLVGPDGSVKQL